MEIISMVKRVIAVTLLIMSSIMVGGCDTAKPVLDVRLAVPEQPSSLLMHIALAEGYFSQELLNPIVNYYPSGKLALQNGILTGKADITTTSDVPFIMQVHHGKSLVALASMYEAENINRIVVRADSGINELKDLSGKRFATQKNSAVHYFAHLTMLENGISEHGNMIYMVATDLPQALADNRIDAFSMREPFVSQARELLGDENVHIFAQPGLYIQNELLVSSPDYVASHPEVARRLLLGLKKAADLVKNDPDKAKQIAAQALHIRLDEVEQIWSSFVLRLEFNQSILLKFERIHAWIKTNADMECQMPGHFLDYIDEHFLKEIEPNQVTIIR